MKNEPTKEELQALEMIYTSELRDVVQGVCGIYCISPEQIVSRESSKRLTEARQVLSYVLKCVFNKSNREVGAYMNRGLDAGKKHAATGREIVNGCSDLIKELVAIIRANESYRDKHNGT